MNDPKYKPTELGFLHEDGYLIPREEPLMVLRGKDIGAMNTIIDYIEMLEEQIPQTPTIDSHLRSSTERLLAFYIYQKENPHLQSVGCSRKAHCDSLYFMKRAKNKLFELGVLNGRE